MAYEWYVLQTLSGQEQKVRDSLLKRMVAEEVGEYIKEVLLPIERVAEVRNGKKFVQARKLYPGYIFIHMKLYDEDRRPIDKPWYFVRDTQGIIGFVGGDHPEPTPDEEVDSIKEQLAAYEDGERPKVDFSLGETVKVNDGPFLNFSGTIEEIDPERGKLKVVVNIFDRSTPVELEYWQVEKT